MIQGISEPVFPGWGWDGDREEDWEGPALTLLALAVVAATALALHWFGSGQDQGEAVPTSTAPEAQPAALLPKSKVSSGIEGQSSRQKSDPARCGQVASGVRDQEPSGGGGQAATAISPLKTPGEIASRGTLGQQHSSTTLEAPQSKGGMPLSTGAGLGKNEGGTSAPLVIHFTLRSPGGEVDIPKEAGDIRDKAPPRQARIQAAEQDASPWPHRAGAAGSLERGSGSRRRKLGDSRGGRSRRTPKPDHLHLGTVVSVWDTVDATSNLSGGPQNVLSPQEQTPVQAGNLTEWSEKGHGKGGPQTAPSRPLDSGGKNEGSRESKGGPTSSEAWPWVKREVLVTRSFSQAPGSACPWPEGPQEARPLHSPMQGTTEACDAGKAKIESSRGHVPLSSERVWTEQPGVHSVREGKGSGQGRGEQRSGQLDSLGFAPCLGRGEPGTDSSWSPLTMAHPSTPKSPPVPASPLTVLPQPDLLLVAPALRASSTSDSWSHGVSWDPSNGGNLRTDPAPEPIPGPAFVPAPTPTLVPAPETVPTPSPTPAPSAAPAPSTTPGPSPAPSAAPAPLAAPSPSPAPSTASAPPSSPGPTPAPSASAPAPLTAPSLSPAPSAALVSPTAPGHSADPVTGPTLTPSSTSVPALDSGPDSAPAPPADQSITPAPAPAAPVTSPQASGSRPTSQRASVGRYKEGQISTSWGNLISMVLRSHPFPRQERSSGRAPKAALESPSAPSSISETRESALPPDGAVPSLKDRQGSSTSLAPEAGTGNPGDTECQTQQSSSEVKGAPTPSPPSGSGGHGIAEKRGEAPLPTTATTRPLSGLPEQPQSDPAPARPVPLPRKRSLCEIADSAERARPTDPDPQQGDVAEDRPSLASDRGSLTEKEKEARKLMVFLQRPGSWGVVEGARKSSSLAQRPISKTALRRRLDLSSCLDVLALAQQHGEPGLAQEAYSLMSNNLLHVLGDPTLYRQLSGAERQRILSLRTRGHSVLGVLVLPSLYQVSRLGLPSRPPGEEAPAGPGPLPPRSPLHVFSPRENSWRLLTQVPAEVPLRGCGLCTMHNYLFLAGGIRGSGAQAVCSNEVFCYNPLTNIWSQVRPMQQARAQLKLVALDGLLYAIGGECLYSMERYDPRTDTWASRAPLPEGTFPVAHEAVACRGDIYVTGGHLFYRLLRYSPEKDAWTECPYSASHRRSSDMVALGGFLYRFDLLRGVGAAVMRYNTVTGSWSRAASLPLPDPAPLRCAVLGNTIYCLNHQVTATFIVSEGTAQFQAKELQPFPLGSKGVLCPFILTLPSAEPRQTAL